MLRLFIPVTLFFCSTFTSLAQSRLEFGLGVIGSGIAVDPLPPRFRNDFIGPISYPGYYAEAATLLAEHKNWKPRVILRFQSEGSNKSPDWPKIRTLHGGIGLVTGYQLTPIISVLGGAIGTYQFSSRVDDITTDQIPLTQERLWGARLNFGVRGDFGKWCSEMIFEKSLSTQTGAVILMEEGLAPFQPTYSALSIRLGIKYQLFRNKQSEPSVREQVKDNSQG